jgi:hypothetical protein
MAQVEGELSALLREVGRRIISHSAPFSVLLKPFSKSPQEREERELHTDSFMPSNSLLLYGFPLNHNFLQAAKPISAPLR